MRHATRFYVLLSAALLLASLWLGAAERPQPTSASTPPVFPTPGDDLPGFPTPAPAPTTVAPTPEATPIPPALYGANLTLHIRGEAREMVDWLWFACPAYEMVTVVQWQDATGQWHTVEGWRGTPDTVVNNEGLKTWWTSDTYFGAGPFRWLVYDRQETRVLGGSAPFTLPTRANTTLHVDVLILQSSMK